MSCHKPQTHSTTFSFVLDHSQLVRISMLVFFFARIKNPEILAVNHAYMYMCVCLCGRPRHGQKIFQSLFLRPVEKWEKAFSVLIDPLRCFTTFSCGVLKKRREIIDDLLNGHTKTTLHMVWRELSAEFFLGWLVITGFRFFSFFMIAFYFSNLWIFFNAEKSSEPFFYFIVESVFFCFVSPLDIRMHFWPKGSLNFSRSCFFVPVKIKEISTIFPFFLRYFLSTKFFCGFWVATGNRWDYEGANQSFKWQPQWESLHNISKKALNQLMEWNVKKECLRLQFVLTQFDFNSRENFSLLLQVWVYKTKYFMC